MTSQTLNAAILGASGYTGAETIRLLAHHSNVRVGAITANAQAGRSLGDLFPHLHPFADRTLVKAEDVNWDGVDVAFGCLPHGASEELLGELPAHVKVIDLSADFRFRDPSAYANVYGRSHLHPEKTRNAVYGLTEFARAELAKNPDIIACPGCYPTASLLAIKPLVEAGVVSSRDIIVDAKSGVSGAGRGLKEGNLFCEAAEGLHAYSIGNHRHAPEIEQELSHASGSPVLVNFTPHLVPMTRGELVTCHVKLANGATVDDVRATLAKRYDGERFIKLAAKGASPDTRWVRGSNLCILAVFSDRIPGRVIVVGVIDNLVKGSGGQAIQNMNVAFGLPESQGLTMEPLFP
ncbi:MAG: N-acetyl-gamma-glutamyl-phosphate reductase [Aquidulcibacter sp.]|jgi:N-acetyl-gamma-glutamyl-phosphate reductase|uniref:N-acetyl-gamma-glutamyl-phosphate reductase n=1 Tax=Aquidulcibacter sp. TaxID=2052990 RepID=UPI0022C9E8AC|nr:N-acetyl-gamma-glutamyl-phosphate reductase [Aquidulcibacter sp.]MCE2891320.1 N-acetyl-gamma-glutamyl-phosphate reductase [Hyphomonadaceae bacterium]MCZ8210142.1 N-acetyl-gamma-glutamyl-phosphate reductase [Aquidulcibacter sp.]